jgi:hypothetical protein
MTAHQRHGHQIIGTATFLNLKEHTMLNQYKKAAIVIAMTTAASLAGLAHAQNAISPAPAAQAASQAPHATHGGSGARSDWLNLGQVYSKLEAAGYTDIREIERERDGYEAKARNRDGQSVKLYVEPFEGRVVREKIRNRD